MSTYDNSSIIEEIDAGQELIQKVKDNPPIHFADYLEIFISSIILIIAIYTKLGVSETSTSNMIRYISKKELGQTEEIEDTLKEFLWISHADRVCVGIFHNGQRVGQLHYDKVSVFYEETGPNIKYIKHNIQNVNLSKVYKHIINTPENSFSKFSRDDDAATNINFSKFLDSISINTVYSRLLIDPKSLEGKNDEKLIYGIVELHYIDSPGKDKLIDPIKVRELDIVFNKLAALLDTRIRKTNKLTQFITNAIKSIKRVRLKK